MAVFLREIFIFLVGGLTRGLVEIISRTLAANDAPHLTSLFSPFILISLSFSNWQQLKIKERERELGICDLWWNIFFAPSIASDQMGCYGLLVLWIKLGLNSLCEVVFWIPFSIGIYQWKKIYIFKIPFGISFTQEGFHSNWMALCSVEVQFPSILKLKNLKDKLWTFHLTGV